MGMKKENTTIIVIIILIILGVFYWYTKAHTAIAPVTPDQVHTGTQVRGSTGPDYRPPQQ
jgi:hypothetical protein